MHRITTSVLGIALTISLAVAGPAAAAEGDGVLTGSVTLADAPLVGATVLVTGGPAPVTATTDGEGRYRVEVPAGSYLVCAGRTDGTVHHSCAPGNPLGTGTRTWSLTDGQEQTLDFTLASSTLPLVGAATPTYAAWQRKGRKYRLVHTAGPLVYRPAAGVAVMDVRVDAIRSFRGVESPFLVDSQRVTGFVKYPHWAGIVPLPGVMAGPVLFDESSCGLPTDRGAHRPPLVHAVPTVVQQVRSAGGAVLLARETPVGESACRRDRVILDLHGTIKRKRRVIRLGARTDSAVQVYRPMARIRRTNGTLLAKRRIRYDGTAALVKLPKRFRKRSLEVKVVLPATAGSPRFVVRQTVRFPKR